MREGIADAALVCVGSDDLTGLHSVEVGEECPVVLLPEDHRLAGRAGVAVADIEGEAGYRAQCPESGLDEIMDRVALGRLVTVVDSAATDRLPSEVTAVPVTDLPPTTLALCWLSGTSTPALPALTEAAVAGNRWYPWRRKGPPHHRRSGTQLGRDWATSPGRFSGTGGHPRHRALHQQ